MLCLCGGLCICDGCIGLSYQQNQSEIRPFQTEKNEVKTPKIPAMRFDLFHLPSFWQFKARESGVFKMKVRLTQK